MDIGTSLRLKIVISFLLTIISEGIFSLIIVSLLKLPIFLFIAFLIILWFFQWLISPYLVGRNSIELMPDDPNYGWVYEIMREVSAKTGIKTQKFI